MCNQSGILLLDKANTAPSTQEKLEKIPWETLELPPYGPNLSTQSCFYFLIIIILWSSFV